MTEIYFLTVLEAGSPRSERVDLVPGLQTPALTQSHCERERERTPPLLIRDPHPSQPPARSQVGTSKGRVFAPGDGCITHPGELGVQVGRK